MKRRSLLAEPLVAGFAKRRDGLASAALRGDARQPSGVLSSNHPPHRFTAKSCSRTRVAAAGDGAEGTGLRPAPRRRRPASPIGPAMAPVADPR